jgi:hypothetical protein
MRDATLVPIDDLQGIVDTATIYHDVLEIGVLLIEQRLYGGFQKGAAIIVGCDDGYFRKMVHVGRCASIC